MQVSDVCLSQRSDALHVARQPILDHRGRLFGYELLYRASGVDSCCLTVDDVSSSRVLTGAVSAIGLDVLTGGKPAFVNFTRRLLVEGLGTLLPPTALVVEVREDVPIDAEVIEACRRLHDSGYALGLDDFVAGSDAELLLPLATFIKVDMIETSAADCRALVARLRPLGLSLVAEKVETENAARLAVAMGFRLLQGHYYCRPETLTTAPIEGRHAAYLELLGALNRDDVSTGQLEDLVKQDFALCYRVLRCVNSPAVGLHRDVNSLSQALVLIGRDRIRKWASVWALAALNTGRADEAVVTALMRARCCESVALGLPEPMDSGAAFLLGLCSLLDTVTGRPMAIALDAIPLPPLVRDALLGASNPARVLLEAVVAYEGGAWTAAERAVASLGASLPSLSLAYADALSWAQAFRPVSEAA